MPMPARTVATSLTRKGFRSRKGDDVYYYLYVDGVKTIVRTKISHGEKEISDSLLSLMAKQVKLTRKLFTDLINCPLSQQQYIEHLRDGGHISKLDSAQES